MNLDYSPVGVSHNFRKLNELYLEVLKINRALLNGGYKTAAPLIKAAAPETNIFFGELNASFVELFDRIRQLKFEIIDNIPRAAEIINENDKNYAKMSNAIYEYIFSGFAICMLEKIIKGEITGSNRKILIDAAEVWEIFTQKLSAFRLPQLNTFLNAPANADVASMFNLMFDSVYEGLKKDIPGLAGLKHNIGVFVREVIEKSVIEGMLLFVSYEEVKRAANH